MKRYLIIKIAAIGDVIMAMPMIDVIREYDREANITWICGTSVMPLLQQISIDQLIVIDEKKLLAGNKIEKIKVVLKIWKKIAFRRYDVLAMGHAALRYKILTLWTCAVLKRSFSHEIGKMWPIPSRHHTDEYVRLILNEARISGVFPPANLYIEPDHMVQNILAECTQKNKIVVLAPGGAKNILADDACRRWPVENYVSVAKNLKEKGYNIVLIGATSDEWVREYFKGIEIIDAVGKVTILQLIGLLGKCDYLVTHDSGPLHLAGLTCIEIIALFGPTNPWEKIPRRDKVHVFWDVKKYACCPCYDGKHYNSSCKENICLKNISAEEICNKICS